MLIGVVEVELLGANDAHDGVEDAELAGGQGTDHDATSGEAGGAELDEASLLSDAEEASGGAALAARALLVDLGEERVRRVRDDCGNDASNDTGAERNGDVVGLARLVGRGVGGLVDGLSGLALHGELSHGVGDLLEEDGTEASVEAEETVGGEHAAHAGAKALGEGRVRDGADADGLERAEEEISNELGHGRRREVDVSALLPRLALADASGNVHLEEFDLSRAHA